MSKQNEDAQQHTKEPGAQGDNPVPVASDSESPNRDDESGSKVVQETTEVPAAEVPAAKTPVPEEYPLMEHTEPERVARANRTKRVLIIIMILLILAGIALGYFAFRMVSENRPQDNDVALSVDTIDPDSIDQNSASGQEAVTSIPQLSHLFGLSVDEALISLGTDYQLASTKEVGEEENPEIVQLAEITYVGGQTSEDTSEHTEGTLVNAPHLYASLNAEGIILEVYYTCSMDLLGYPSSSFSTLTAESDTLISALKAVGITLENYDYAAPTIDQYTYYVDPAATEKVVSKEAFTFSGETGLDVAPKTWDVTITYDHTVSASTADVTDIVRMISINLA